MSNNPESLQDSIALVTGGSRGIGLGIARQFVRLGATVVITGRDQATLDQACRELGESAHSRINDVDVLELHEPLLQHIEEELGSLDILVNNAGRHCKKPALETSDQDFREILQTNLASVFSLSRACLARMMPRGKGSIINISSMSALYGLTEVAAYSSSKSGLLGLTRTLASECSGSGVRINAIAPGFIDSQMFLEIMEKDPARKQRILDRTPMQRFGTADEIGHAAAFLASDAAAFITGICLPVDGGNSIGF